MTEIRRAQAMSDQELFVYAKEIQAPYTLLKQTAQLGNDFLFICLFFL